VSVCRKHNGEGHEPVALHSIRCESGHGPGGEMDLLFIVLIVVLVLALLGFFGRSYW
jgi:hypothetical protein